MDVSALLRRSSKAAVGGCCLFSPSSLYWSSSLVQPAVRMHHGSCSTAENVAASFSVEQYIEEMEPYLKERYGPQAKLVLHKLHQRRPEQRQKKEKGCRKEVEEEREESALATSSNGTGSSAAPLHGEVDTNAEKEGPPTEKAEVEEAMGRGQDHYYRASATFRLLGFPVELAAVRGLRQKETIDACMSQALDSDVEFIRPAVQHRGGPNAQGYNRGAAGTHRDTEGSATAQSTGQQRHHHQNRKRWNESKPQHPSSHDHSAALSPHQQELKAILDDLRHLCIHFSRTVKFSIKPPSIDSSTATGEVRQWRCRSYVKEEWSAVAHMQSSVEGAGTTPNEALARCVAELRQCYRDELESPETLKEGVWEVAALLQPMSKTVTAYCNPETTAASAPTSDGGELSDAATSSLSPFATQVATFQPTTYTASLEVRDSCGNVNNWTSKRQPTPYVAYQAAAMTALRSELMWDPGAHLLMEGLPTSPMLQRMRWQFELMVDYICRYTGKPASEIASVRLSEDRSSSSSSSAPPAVTEMESSNGSSNTRSSGSGASPTLPFFFTGSLYSDGGILVWQQTSGGRYRVEFDTYVQALYYLLDQYGDVVQHLPCLAAGKGDSVLFPTAAILELHVRRHDTFPVLQHHRGKWNCYALLGTLTSQLLGCYYATRYHFDAASSDWVATLTVNDGRAAEQPLIQRRSKNKGESWRLACLDAIRLNFPRQYGAVLERHPDLDLSGDTMARGSKYRTLPREKRIQHMSDIFSMVAAFAEEDLGWRQMRIRLRNMSGDIGLPQWVAEMEAQVDGEEGRRVVAVSPPFTQVRQSRRSLVYRIAKQYFPKELETYKTLGRSDSGDPDEDINARRTQLYQPTHGTQSSFVEQLFALVDRKHPSSSPLSFSLGICSSDTANEESSDMSSYLDGDIGLLQSQDPDQLLYPLALSYEAQVLGNHGDLLIAECSSATVTASEKSAVAVLIMALKSASQHFGGADAQTLWTEYETHQLPPVSTAKELSIALFNQFFGTSPAAAKCGNGVEGLSSIATTPTSASNTNKAKEDLDEIAPAIDVIATPVGDYWFGTAVLPRLCLLPIARAIATSKRACITDALQLAARQSFGRILHYASKHDVGASSLATDILTEPVVEQLPQAVVDDLRAQLERAKRHRVAPPFQLLVQSIKKAYPLRERCIRVQYIQDNTHGFQYRLYLQRGRQVKRSETQLVGYGASTVSPAIALHQATILALENLFEEELASAIRQQPNYRNPNVAIA